MLCAALACVAMWSQPPQAGSFGLQAEPSRPVLTVVLVADAAVQVLPDTEPAPAIGLGTATADLAGDLPELLMAESQPAAETAAFAELTQPQLYVLPHPFLERPQRPPRLTPFTA